MKRETNEKLVISPELEENISRELKKSSAFQILTLWENIAHYCAGEMVASISSLSKPSTKWDKNICEIFYALSFAQLANHLNIEDSNEMIQNALITINYALTDVFEKKNIFTGITLPGYILKQF